MIRNVSQRKVTRLYLLVDTPTVCRAHHSQPTLYDVGISQSIRTVVCSVCDGDMMGPKMWAALLVSPIWAIWGARILPRRWSAGANACNMCTLGDSTT